MKSLLSYLQIKLNSKWIYKSNVYTVIGFSNDGSVVNSTRAKGGLNLTFHTTYDFFIEEYIPIA